MTVSGSRALSLLLADKWVSSSVTPAFALAAGSTLFRGRLPDTPDEVVLLLDVASLPAEHTYGRGPLFTRPRVQVLVRAAGHERADTIAQQLRVDCEATNVEVAGVTLLRSQAVTEPHPSERDGRDRMLFIFTVDLWLSV